MHTALFCHVFLSCAKYFFLWEKLWKVFNMSISKEKVEVKAIVRVQKCHHTEKKYYWIAIELYWIESSAAVACWMRFSIRCDALNTAHFTQILTISFVSSRLLQHVNFKEGIGISISVWGDVNLSLFSCLLFCSFFVVSDLQFNLSTLSLV